MSLLGSFLTQLTTGDQVRDYQHAARTFVDSLYRLGPKFQSLFHVYIDIDPEMIAPISDKNNALARSLTSENLVEIGLLAKTVALPKYSVQTKVYNAYNRKNIAQERINYDPVRITFHDDSANTVRDFWQRYYSFHYRDSDYPESVYTARHKYESRQQSAWGFSPLSTGTGTTSYIKSIRIYSLHQKNFSSYILINPVIKEFAHGEHRQGEYELLEHSMTIEYETVLYESGPVSQGNVQGWNIVHYDNTPSPLTSLGGGTRSILGPGGAIETVQDAVTNLQSGNFAAAGLGIARAAQNWKNTDIKAVASSEFAELSKNILRGQNTQATVFAPTSSAIKDGLSRAVTSINPLNR